MTADNGVNVLAQQLTGRADYLSTKGSVKTAGLLRQAAAALATPIPMILHCPACHTQHIDAPESTWKDALEATGRPVPPEAETAAACRWTNPPHRSHLCHSCGHVWRPADVPTTGVLAIETKGKADSAP